MVKAILFIILGASSTLFLFFIFAPIFWRRAVFLAKKQLEECYPFSLEEVQASHDAYKAQHVIELYKANQKYKKVKKDNMNNKIILSKAQEELLNLRAVTRNYNDLQQEYGELHEIIKEDNDYIKNLIEENQTEEEINENLLCKLHQTQEDVIREKAEKLENKLHNINNITLALAQDKLMRKIINKYEKYLAKDKLNDSDTQKIKDLKAKLKLVSNNIKLNDSAKKLEQENYLNQIKDEIASLSAEVSGSILENQQEKSEFKQELIEKTQRYQEQVNYLEKLTASLLTK